MLAELSKQLYRFREPSTGRVCIAKRVLIPESKHPVVRLPREPVSASFGDEARHTLYHDDLLGLIWLPADVEVEEHEYRKD